MRAMSHIDELDDYEADLELKKGARVMLIKNDPEGRWVNGSLATVEAFKGDNVVETPTLRNFKKPRLVAHVLHEQHGQYVSVSLI